MNKKISKKGKKFINVKMSPEEYRKMKTEKKSTKKK
jgi:hypothetical protein